MAAGFKRLHRLSKAYDRAAPPALSVFEQLAGVRALGLETPRQRVIRERSEARYSRRADRYDPPEGGLLRGELGVFETFRFITSAEEP